METLTMKTLLLLLSVGLLHVMAVETEAKTIAEDWPEDVVEAVRTDPTVRAEVSRIRKRFKAYESTQEDIKILGLGVDCGVDGCSTSYLASITVQRRGNPQSASVLATV